MQPPLAHPPPPSSTHHDQPFSPIHLFGSQTRGMSGCARATPAAWPPLCYPTRKTKGCSGRPAACLRGTQCHEAGSPPDPGPSITCPLYASKRQGASVVCMCVCVWVSNLRYYAREEGRTQRVWIVYEVESAYLKTMFLL